MRILFYPINYSDRSGGSMVFHKLCHDINTLGGHAAFLSPAFYKEYGPLKDTNPNQVVLNKNYNTPMTSTVDLDEDIIIYPEGTEGNPFNFKKVVRWILYYPEKHIEDKYKQNDLLLFFNKKFSEKTLINNRSEMKDRKQDSEPELLFCFEAGLDTYKDLGIQRDVDEAVFVYKAREKKSFSLDEKHKSLLEIPPHLPGNQLLQVFNRTKKVYFYDTTSWSAIIAVLCGCEVILMPEEGMKEEEFFNKNPWLKYGMAYGKDQAPKLKEKQKLIAFLNERQELSEQTVKKFINHTLPDYFN